MDNLEKEIKRKINIRKMAIKNMGLNDDNDMYFRSDNEKKSKDSDRLYYILNENIREANDHSYQNAYWILSGKKITIFIKKLLRKLVRIFYGWFLFPMIDRQSHFNGKTVNSLTILKDIITKQEQTINQLINKCDNLEKNMQIKQDENNQNLFNKIKSITQELEYQIENNDHKLHDEIEEVAFKLLTQIDYNKKSLDYFQSQVSPGSRFEVLDKRNIIIDGIIDFELQDRVQQLEKATNEDVTDKLRNATEYYIETMQKKLAKRAMLKKDLIIIYCLRFREESGIEAIKNEAYDLFQLLSRESKYDVKILSLEHVAEEPNYSDHIIYVDKKNINKCMGELAPSLIILIESTPYIIFNYDGVLIKNHTLIKLTGQNPLQGLDEGIIEELRHCNDFGVHQYLVESQNAYDVMFENGFRNVILSYPVIDSNRVTYKERKKIHQGSFVVGFASSPMEEKQFDDRGMNLLLEVMRKLPDVTFKILWRNELLQVSAAFEELNNCEIYIGKYNMELFYQEIDCIIVPYRTVDYNHACSLSGVEAMLNNIPVVCTNVAGISELVNRFDMGVICEPTSMNIVSGINTLISNYNNYIGHNKVKRLKEILDSRQIVSIIENTLMDYYPKNFVTLDEWNYHLVKKDKYLVKGHSAIKEYYQNKDVANNYNDDRFLQYPTNYFDAFERASIGLLIKAKFHDNHLKILDIASGDGRIVQEIIKYGECTSIDSSMAMLDIVKERYGKIGELKTEICDYFTDDIANQYDVITTFRYIRHFDYKQRKILYKRLWNNLNKNGILIFDAPNIKYAMKNREQGNWDDFNIYDVFWTEKSIIQELNENNFEAIYLIPIGVKTIENDPVSWTVAAVKK
ncbi:glycosyltransferase [Anaerocolumna sp. AGMB13025]|uniref:glycosyltransferase n=1 Tax=Anaerocolumna sp. AGMB13025 TaxID=3039116 RepID=UPI00241CE3CE|nr:methyltransferase domain-containing protein [Anaerocolumna sp. AGMB13025]WFR56318.1 glycosyltransferase [Anaerocolumna sp. AGMB13025]